MQEGENGLHSDVHRQKGEQLKKMPCVEIIFTKHKLRVMLTISRQQFLTASWYQAHDWLLWGIFRGESCILSAKPDRAIGTVF